MTQTERNALADELERAANGPMLQMGTGGEFTLTTPLVPHRLVPPALLLKAASALRQSPETTDARAELCTLALSFISLIRYGGGVTFDDSALPKKLSDFLENAHAKLAAARPSPEGPRDDEIGAVIEAAEQVIDTCTPLYCTVQMALSSHIPSTADADAYRKDSAAHSYAISELARLLVALDASRPSEIEKR